MASVPDLLSQQRDGQNLQQMTDRLGRSATASPPPPMVAICYFAEDVGDYDDGGIVLSGGELRVAEAGNMRGNPP